MDPSRPAHLYGGVGVVISTLPDFIVVSGRPSSLFPFAPYDPAAPAAHSAMMNFVDVQPRSFLDYAWTSPSPAAMGTVKPTKTTRKQNRCCDQCRKGKRACDAAILEDTLLEANQSGESPTVFHYSGEQISCRNDRFGVDLT